MNDKGFTTIELIVTIVLVIVIMATITNVTFSYRDRSIYEESVTELVNYKNVLTKIIYDDILIDNVVSIKRSDENNFKEIVLVKSDGSEIKLTVYNGMDEGYIIYNDVKYVVPGAADNLVNISDINLKRNNDLGIYVVDITLVQRVIDESFTIHFVVT